MPGGLTWGSRMQGRGHGLLDRHDMKEQLHIIEAWPSSSGRSRVYYTVSQRSLMNRARSKEVGTTGS